MREWPGACATSCDAQDNKMLSRVLVAALLSLCTHLCVPQQPQRLVLTSPGAQACAVFCVLHPRPGSAAVGDQRHLQLHCFTEVLVGCVSQSKPRSLPQINNLDSVLGIPGEQFQVCSAGNKAGGILTLPETTTTTMGKAKTSWSNSVPDGPASAVSSGMASVVIRLYHTFQ